MRVGLGKQGFSDPRANTLVGTEMVLRYVYTDGAAVVAAWLCER